MPTGNEVPSGVSFILNDAVVTLAIATFLLALFLAIFADGFLSQQNLINVLRQISLTSIMSIGFAIVVITGGMDISMGSVAALVGMFVAALISFLDVNIPTSILLALLLGTAIGALNGIVIAYLGVPPFIGTLAMLFIVQGVTFQTTDGFPIYEGLTGGFLYMGQGYIGPLPIPVLIMVLLFIVFHYFLTRTVWGQHIYAIGGNENSARVTGVNVPGVKVIAYSLAGFCAALTGIVITARLGTAQPAAAGLDFFLTAITAAVLGGVALTGGQGTMLGVFFGSLFLGILANGLTLLKLSSYTQWTITGIILIGSIVWNSFQMRKGGLGHGR